MKYNFFLLLYINIIFQLNSFKNNEKFVEVCAKINLKEHSFYDFKLPYEFYIYDKKIPQKKLYNLTKNKELFLHLVIIMHPKLKHTQYIITFLKEVLGNRIPINHLSIEFSEEMTSDREQWKKVTKRLKDNFNKYKIYFLQVSYPWLDIKNNKSNINSMIEEMKNNIRLTYNPINYLDEISYPVNDQENKTSEDNTNTIKNNTIKNEDDNVSTNSSNEISNETIPSIEKLDHPNDDCKSISDVTEENREEEKYSQKNKNPSPKNDYNVTNIYIYPKKKKLYETFLNFLRGFLDTPTPNIQIHSEHKYIKENTIENKNNVNVYFLDNMAKYAQPGDFFHNRNKILEEIDKAIKKINKNPIHITIYNPPNNSYLNGMKNLFKECTEYEYTYEIIKNRPYMTPYYTTNLNNNKENNSPYRCSYNKNLTSTY
ncbi:hypothetical protein AB836_00010 [Rickettsiales bacterium (ex Bugula neritina AB1)]|nr:hypothetical protein AB836_00010 [Rickettsiales bacterium (ex Bugula neritina AB1)]